MGADVELDEWLGRTLSDGRYTILRALGQGGMGAVFAARDSRAGIEVALKVLHPRLAEEQRHLGRFRREAAATSRLDHPHVVKALDTGTDPDGTAWLVMELVAGRTLSAIMRARQGATLGVTQTVVVARQIVSALTAVAEIGVIHRDLKPANVMVVETGAKWHVKVVDFGLARFLSSPAYRTLTLTGQVVGTPSYMAPEQVFGDRVDARTDIYSVGAIMHTLLTGSPPFASGPDVLVRLMNDDRAPLTATRPELGPISEVVERCLMHDPGQRYANAITLDRALETFDLATDTVSEWSRPAEISTLVLEPDAVLDAPKAVATPTLPGGAPPPTVGTPRPGPDSQKSAPRRRGLLLLLGLIVFAASLISVAVFSSPSAPVEQTTPEVAGVTPVEISADVGDAASPAIATDASPDVFDKPDERPERQGAAGMHCSGSTGIWPTRGTDGPLIQVQMARVAAAISSGCYTRQTREGESQLEIDVGSDGRVRRARWMDRGSLHEGEAACVRRTTLRHTQLREHRTGTAFVPLRVGWRALKLYHTPDCR